MDVFLKWAWPAVTCLMKELLAKTAIHCQTNDQWCSLLFSTCLKIPSLCHMDTMVGKKICINEEAFDINSLFFKHRLFFTLAYGHSSTFRRSFFKHLMSVLPNVNPLKTEQMVLFHVWLLYSSFRLAKKSVACPKFSLEQGRMKGGSKESTLSQILDHVLMRQLT